jgi:hypothetical protein
MSGSELLEFVCYIGAGLGLVAYALGLFRVRRFARVWNTAGLFLTAGALALLPHAVQVGDVGAEETTGWAVAILLLLALFFQAFASLRGRAPREGRQDRAADRRGEGARERATDRSGDAAA